MTLKSLPIGIDGFEKIRENNFYYVDKTMFIAELLNNWGEVNLFTRPRRFGKSLNMSMLKSFLEIGCNKNLFDMLKISREKELCEKYMGQFPVISLTLKAVDGLTYREAREALRFLIGEEAGRFSFLAESSMLTDDQKFSYRALTGKHPDGSYTMSDVALVNSIKTLSHLLSLHFERKVIILLDEYDVPLDKSFQNGYYTEMLSLIRSLFGNALKGNNSLQFAVLTGCLRISKESIFTGLNNLKVHGITDLPFDEYFGFTHQEVQNLLDYYHLTEHSETMKEWYNGYRFGEQSVYCPWDVLNYCDKLLRSSKATPENYWANTSGNDMIRRFIDKSDKKTKEEIERLIAGEAISKSLNMELTYNELDRSMDNLWSVLFTTGYLTLKSDPEDGLYPLMIPNREIRSLFISQIQIWFKETAQQDASRLKALCQAFPKGDAATVESLFNSYLWNSISIRDTFVRKSHKENLYHGMLLGLLQYMENWSVRSNAESGEGFSDILIETPERVGIVIEFKYADDDNLSRHCQEALSQIEERQYESLLIKDHMETVIKYGIACCRKHCRVMMADPAAGSIAE